MGDINRKKINWRRHETTRMMVTYTLQKNRNVDDNIGVQKVK